MKHRASYKLIEKVRGGLSGLALLCAAIWRKMSEMSARGFAGSTAAGGSEERRCSMPRYKFGTGAGLPRERIE